MSALKKFKTAVIKVIQKRNSSSQSKDSLEEEKDLMSDASQNTSEDASKKDNANDKTTSRTSSFRLRSKVTEVKKTVMPENNHNLPSPTIKLTKEEKERLKNDVMLMNLEAVGLQDLIH